MSILCRVTEGTRGGHPWAAWLLGWPLPCWRLISSADSSHITEWGQFALLAKLQPLYSWSGLLLWELLACFQLPHLGFNFFIMWACTGQPNVQQGRRENSSLSGPQSHGRSEVVRAVLSTPTALTELILLRWGRRGAFKGQFLMSAVKNNPFVFLKALYFNRLHGEVVEVTKYDGLLLRL